MKAPVTNERFEALGGKVVGYHALMSGRYTDGFPKSRVPKVNSNMCFRPVYLPKHGTQFSQQIQIFSLKSRINTN